MTEHCYRRYWDQSHAIVKGYDVSQNAVRRAKAKGLDVQVRDACVDGLDGTFDYVIIADCLEHPPVPEQLIVRLCVAKLVKLFWFPFRTPAIGDTVFAFALMEKGLRPPAHCRTPAHRRFSRSP